MANITQYEHQAYPLNSIIGFLFRNELDDQARLLAGRTQAEMPVGLINIDAKENISFPGLALIQKGQGAAFKALAAQYPDAAKAVLLFGTVNNADLQKTLLLHGKPETIGDVFESVRVLFGGAAFDFVTIAIKSLSKSNDGEDISLANLKALREAAAPMTKTPEQVSALETFIGKCAAQGFAQYVDGSYGFMRPSDDALAQYRHKYDDLRALLGEEAGNALITGLMKDGLIHKQVKRAGSNFFDGIHVSFLTETFAQAARAGVGAPDMAAMLMAADVRGLSPVEHAFERPEVAAAVIGELRRDAGEAEANAWLSAMLDKPRALANADIFYDLQYVRNDGGSEAVSAACEALSYYRGDGDAEKMRAQIEAARPAIYKWLDTPGKDRNPERDARLRAFADATGPVTEGPTLLARKFSPALLHLKAELSGLPPATLAQALYDDMAMIADLKTGGTSMHTSWAASTLMGPPGSAKSVQERLSGFIAALDTEFGTDIAVPLAAKLFALRDTKGLNPLEYTLNDGPDGQYAPYYHEAIVTNLAAALHDDAKFTRYMDEAIVPNLPASFGGRPASVSAAVNKYLPKPGPR